MSPERTAASAARSVGSGAARVVRAWRVLPHERRLAAAAALGLFVSLFLPWYQETVIAPGKTKLQSASASVTGWGAFSFVEAAVLLVAVGVLTLLVQRSEGRAFHLPGGDGWVIMLAGFWTCVLVIWRIFDKQGTSSHQQYATTSGIEWGIFVALAVAVFLTYTGSRIRAAHTPEPPLPGDAESPAGAVIARPAGGASRAEPEPRRGGDDPPPRPRSLRNPAQPDAAAAPQPVPAEPPQPAPARPPEPGSPSDRRTGWLTAPPVGWTEDPNTIRPEPTTGWSYADDYAGEVPGGREDEYEDEPPTRAAPPRRSAGGSRPEDPTNVQEPSNPDDSPPRSPPPGRRRQRQPDDQLTIRLDRDNDA
jgi:hypothetical protein